MTDIFNLSHTSSYLHPLQVNNFKLERVLISSIFPGNKMRVEY